MSLSGVSSCDGGFFPTEALSPPLSNKRKRDLKDASAHSIGSKKKKRAKRKKTVVEEELDLENDVNLTFGKLDNQLLADYLARRTKHFEPDLSLLELEERRIPVGAFCDTSTWNKQRVLTNLPEFLNKYSSRAADAKILSEAPRKKGTPHTLVIAASGLRAADITRVLRVFETKEGAVAKLFAKHIKLSDAIEYVGKTRMCVGVGTPARIIDLLDSGALSCTKLERIIVDCSHIDRKKRGILDMKETLLPLIVLLNRQDFKHRYVGNNETLDLLFF